MRQLLEQSLSHYRVMYSLMLELDTALGKDDPDLLVDIQKRLLAVQDEVQAVDVELEPLLSVEGEDTLSALLAERRVLLQDLQAYNRLLSVKIHGILPVISDELAQLRTGRVAVSGYASGQQARGDLVRGAF